MYFTNFKKVSIQKKCLEFSLFGKTHRSIGSVDCSEAFDKHNLEKRASVWHSFSPRCKAP